MASFKKGPTLDNFLLNRPHTYFVYEKSMQFTFLIMNECLFLSNHINGTRGAKEKKNIYKCSNAGSSKEEYRN